MSLAVISMSVKLGRLQLLKRLCIYREFYASFSTAPFIKPSSFQYSGIGFVKDCCPRWTNVCLQTLGSSQGSAFLCMPQLSVSVRHYAKKLSFEYSGDATAQKRLQKGEILFNSKQLEDLQQCSQDVKRLSSIEFADGRAIKSHRQEIMYDRMERLFGPNCNLEKRVAKLTVDIRTMIPHCFSVRQDSVTKAHVVEKIQKRRRILKYLRQQDHERFLWLLQELRIRYNHEPAFTRKLSRRDRRKRIVMRKWLRARSIKLEELRRKLESERVAFEDYKKAAMEDIERDIQELNLNRDLLLKGQLRKQEPVASG